MVFSAREKWEQRFETLSERQKRVEPSVQWTSCTHIKRLACNEMQELSSNTKNVFRFYTTLRQTYSLDIQRVQFAFKDSMIHLILSVSCPYLALEGVYLPFWAEFPINPTRRKHLVSKRTCRTRGSHPLRRAVPSNLSTPPLPWQYFHRLQFAVASNRDFKLELFPIHSPLLRESLLVSFPPLINMLKFSG